jgi:molybdopterin-guanine dinucleotide biosynthesis protein B
VHELREESEPTLAVLLAKASPVDLVLIEGYKREHHPKLEVYRAAVGKPLLHPDDRAIVAIASDVPLPQARVPRVDLNDIEAIADILVRHAAPVDSMSSAHSRASGNPEESAGSPLSRGRTEVDT